MKKQLTGNKLAFNKMAITELNDSEIQQVNGGASSTSLNSIPITIFVVTLL
ncbi:class I lanthipeptide [Flavobacterium sp. 1355]|jgi:hypothetical protein|uniref:class I lanthipeptide n=1 Tax=Flavobacterium sp. 1355 TaxID=2806571 RepID=UPI001AE75937|nr:class I lanthipeptide [Flavobacterium sp. 1355]MBP1221926.1 hypothetical protein [Flavobacterium sp. 1355]